MMKKLLILSVIVLNASFIFAQNTIVQTFNFESTTRDTVISFPEGDHNKYERILMHYGMRCKDGLVSTGSERNKGCGEWDYSCNTYVVDSTKVDSVKATSVEFSMPGFNGDVFEYSNDQTYGYFSTLQKEVTYLNVFAQFEAHVVNGTEALDNDFGKVGSQLNMTYIIPAADFETAELRNKRITGLSFPITDGDITFKNLRIKVQETTKNSVDIDLLTGDWVEVCNSNTNINTSNTSVKFHTSIFHESTMNMAINISYDAAEGEDLVLKGSTSDNAIVNDLRDEKYLFASPSGKVNVSNGLPDVLSEITISYWIKGDYNLPTNTTSLEGMDDSGNRQVNIHHPWSNGQVYWDCGNEGNYDRINKTANPEDFKNQWNHWAFTKNANTGEMKMFLNGALWHEGTEKFNTINVTDLNIGGAIRNQNLHYYGGLDEIQIWNKALDEETIKDWMNRKIDSDHPSYDNLVLYYDFNNLSGTEVVDLSPHANDGEVVGNVSLRDWTANSMFIGANRVTSIPNQSFRQDDVEVMVDEVAVLDSFPAQEQKVEQLGVDGTDLISLSTNFYFPAGQRYVYNENGEIVDSVFIQPEGSIQKGELNYYNKSPMAFEIMSFVTPYGIGIDFGLEGHSWTFDVTEYGPVLKGDKRIFMSRGGQWQEEMDISFEFIEGIPDRNVLDINQIWKVDKVGYTSIQNDWKFEPREFVYDPVVANYIIRTVVTGHGQEGEFIPRTHLIDLSNAAGNFTDSWQVWTECAENPIAPQGGTWVYDRAGWCPGAASDIRETDVTQFFNFLQTPIVDYNIPAVSGSSDYIVSSQLIEYGSPNKEVDLGIEDVIYPSGKIEHSKFNPTCRPPKIVIKNHGETAIENAVIKYGIVGKVERTYYWSGNIGFGNEQEVTLGYMPALVTADDDDMFFATVEAVNSQSDNYTNNNEYIAPINLADYYEGDLVIEFRTNNVANETAYRVFNLAGDQLLYRGGNLSSNTIYRDTLSNLNGCYRIEVEDSDDDGLSWWANNDGNGYIRVYEIGGTPKVIATDFGKFLEYNFMLGFLSSDEEVHITNELSVYPNPGTGTFYFDGLDQWQDKIKLQITDQMGRQVFSKQMDKSVLLSGTNVLESAPSGFYYITLKDQDKTKTLKYLSN